ncbi:MAG: NAD(P)H-hydrate dehydratase [Deltaproteobacteria bacterium]|nr:NAD(P)H-hydrate dehydratase [Deltaproteobacteria bacterium]
MKVLTGEQMHELDQQTFSSLGLPSVVYMENAAREVAHFIVEHYQPAYASVVIFCGPGNNGGDGFSIARTLKHLGWHVSVLSTREMELLKGDAALQAQAYRKIGGTITTVTENLQELSHHISSAHLIVDCLLGTGFNGAPEGILAQVIELINTASCPVLSVDLPSGVDASSANVPGVAVRAKQTIAIQYPKLGTVLFPGAQYTGELFVVDVGICHRAETEYFLMTADFVAQGLRKYFQPSTQRHKGQRGKVLVVGGSAGLYGAPKMAAAAALRTGAGLATFTLPQTAAAHIAPEQMELMCAALADDGQGGYGQVELARLEALLKQHNCLVFGPGLGRSSQGQELSRLAYTLAAKNNIPLLIDADGLNTLAENDSLKSIVPANSILTPHAGEMAGLLGKEVTAIQSQRLEAAKLLAQSLNSIVVLKGARTVIAAPYGELAINPAATDTLATAGSGDVLCGIIAALVARGCPPFAAANYGVYLHGEIGQKLHDEFKSSVGVTATDIIEALPKTIAALCNQNEVGSGFCRQLLKFPLSSA